MEGLSALAEYISVGIISAVIGGIFGASGLLFFPLRRYMEQKLEKAENDAIDRAKYQKEMFTIGAEEKAVISRYVFWLKETIFFILNDCHEHLDGTDYWKDHLSECANELNDVQKKRKGLEREQLAEINFDKKN